MDTLFQDIRYALRKLARTPGFTLIATLTLALAIGANTAIFSVVDGVLLRPLPFAEPEQLVRIASVKDGKNYPSSTLDFIDLRDQSHSFAYAAAMTPSTVNLTAAGADPQRLALVQASANFFSLLRVQPAIGRGFVAGEDTEDGPRVVVLSDKLWRARFAADPRIVGRPLTLDGTTYTVIGVAPRDFTYPTNPDLWAPLVFSRTDLRPDNRGAHWLMVIGRLAPGATLAGGTQEVGAIAQRLEAQYPEMDTGFGARLIPLREEMVGQVRPALLVLLGAVGFVLLIACANVANLLLVRAASREGEIAIRTALGAGRARIIRQLVTESLILAFLGGVAGVILAAWGVDLLVALGPERLPRLNEVHIDASVLLFTTAVALVTGVVFGLIPAMHAARPGVGQMLREGSRGTSAPRASGRVRGLLVVTEMALAVVLLTGAGLLIRSFVRLLAVDPGFRPEHVVTFNLTLPEPKYSAGQRVRAVVADLSERMKTLPGAQATAIGFGLPMSGMQFRTNVDVAGRPPLPPGKRNPIDVRIASPGYFATLGIPLLRGRDFTSADRATTTQVALINQETARRYFSGEDPVGKRIELGWSRDTAGTGGPTAMGGEIIGIVGDVKQFGLSADATPMTYLPFEQAALNDLSVVVRSTADPAAVGNAARRLVREVDPDLPIFGFTTLEDVIAESVSQPRFYTLLLGVFAGLALILAAVGIYGVISYLVSQRTRELGIRIALGATAPQVLRLVLGQGLVLAIAGVVVGLGASFWLTRLIASLLYGVGAADPLTFFGVVVVLLAVASLACYLPARRAARVDPLTAIRGAD
jgi:putative ABC transport system permease protein